MTERGRVDVALLTDRRYESPSPDRVTPYVQNILSEDDLVRGALQRRGARAVRVDWARADFDWAAVRAAVFRTTWDYFTRFAEFSAWLEQVSTRTRLINPIELVRWNLDKRYLLDLGGRGLPVAPTVVLERASGATLGRTFETLGCREIVLKPAVSGAGRHTYRIARSRAAEHEARLAELLAGETMLAQPFLPRVLEDGEVTLVVLDGHVTHAVRKRGRPGDFRVQDDHGGTVHPHEAENDEVELALHAVAACDPRPAYARVDIVREQAGRPLLMELELVEPELFFRFCPAAADRFATAIVGRLT